MQTQTTTSTAKLVLAWAFVGIPLAWGVIMTLSNAMALFR
ncbi:MFS transporter small subunit [Mangrovicella endophytica]